MGLSTRGMDEWLADLESLPERAVKPFTQIMKRAGGNIKDDWSARWTAMPHAHIPHLVQVRALSYDTDQKGWTFSVEVGVRAERLQARLASFIEYGTLTSAPHPAGMPALEAEAPRMAQWAAKVAEDLLNGAKP
jgi:hypothetical protein